MKKPTVQIKEWGIYRRHPGENQWALEGVVLDHPRFETGTHVTTSSILQPDQAGLSGLKDGDHVETRNTVYVLVGDNQNGSGNA